MRIILILISFTSVFDGLSFNELDLFNLNKSIKGLICKLGQSF